MKKFWITFLPLFILTAAQAYAAAEIPEKSAKRITWAIQCSGKPPLHMCIAAGILAVCVIISVIYYKHITGGDDNA